MSDPQPDRRAYLDRVAAALRLHPASEADVLDELADHIAESVAGLRNEGLAPEPAEREALARLGDPAELAAGIRSARQTTRRLLLATGHGVWAAAGGAIWGYLFAFALVLLSSTLSMLVIGAVINQRQVSVSGWDMWSAVLSIPYALFASAYAGRVVPPAVARRSDRPMRSVARPVAIVGGVVLAVLCLLVVRIPLDAGMVIVLALVPVGFAVGAWTATEWDAAGRPRLRARWILGIVALSTLAMSVLGVATMRINSAQLDLGPDPALERIGPPASDVIGTAGVGTSRTWTRGGPMQLGLTADPPTALSGWGDLRLEAWPAADQERPRVDPSASGPTVTAPLVVDDGGWSGQMQIPATKERSWFVLVTTGVAPDGRRYVLSGPDSQMATEPWVGSVWEWFTTP
jgi:uncharacterized membrane protein